MEKNEKGEVRILEERDKHRDKVCVEMKVRMGARDKVPNEERKDIPFSSCPQLNLNFG